MLKPSHAGAGPGDGPARRKIEMYGLRTQAVLMAVVMIPVLAYLAVVAVSIASGGPEVAMVIRDRCSPCATSATVRLSML